MSIVYDPVQVQSSCVLFVYKKSDNKLKLSDTSPGKKEIQISYTDHEHDFVQEVYYMYTTKYKKR